MKTQEMYLDWVNNFLTVERFAQYHGISIDKANLIIEEGRTAYKNKTSKLHRKMFENIYDVACNTRFRKSAMKELDKWTAGKEVSWDGDRNIISIGKFFKVKLLEIK